MGIFGGYRADRLIAEVRESGDPDSAKAKAALAKLQSLGGAAIKPIVDALATADKRETVAFVETLTPLVDNKTFPALAEALAEENPRAAVVGGEASPCRTRMREGRFTWISVTSASDMSSSSGPRPSSSFSESRMSSS